MNTQCEIDLNKIGDFLKERFSRLRMISIALNLHKNIGEQFPPMRSEGIPSLSPYDDGTIYQLFSFLQAYPLTHFICTQFITTLSDKMWKDIFSSLNNCENKSVFEERFKLIKDRYNEPRNNVICHTADNEPNTPNWRAEHIQAFEDMQKLRDIINEIRTHFGLSSIAVAFDGEEYQVQGLRKLFEILFSTKT